MTSTLRGRNMWILMPEEKCNIPKKGGRDEYYNESDLQVWKDRCLRRGRGDKRNGEQVGRPADSGQLYDAKQHDATTIPVTRHTPAAKTDTQKGGQKIVPVVSQHSKG
ncbi:hypothetical protein ACSBR1_012589 [Camellia fascicularis]